MKDLFEIVICDDNIEDLNNIAGLIHSILYEQKIDCEIKLFASANEMLHRVEKIHIGILDIVMDEHDGISVGQKLKEKFPDVQIIYTTSYEHYVMEAVNKVHAYSFLCKPIEYEILKEQIIGLLRGYSDEVHEKEFQKVIGKNNTEYTAIKLDLDEILYLEYIKSSRKAKIVLDKETYVYKCVFKKVVEELEQYGFVEICRGYLVNLRHVAKIKGYTVYMDNDRELHVSQCRLADFKKRLNAFVQRNS